VDFLLEEDLEVFWILEWDTSHHIDGFLPHSVTRLAPIDMCCVHRGGVPGGHRSGVGVARASVVDREA
jgi:hypothetical protein